MKEEVDYSDPTDTVTEVPTVDLLGPQIAEPSIGGAASSAPAEHQVSDVVEGAGPSAPSRPPRTRGTRGGKDTQFQKLRRAYYSGYEKARSWLFEHTRPRHSRPGFTLPKMDFETATARHQELLINWEFYSARASVQQLLCEFEFLIPYFAQWVTHSGYQGEGAIRHQHWHP